MAKTMEALKRAEEERKPQTEKFTPSRETMNLNRISRGETENQRLKHNLLQLIPEKDIKTILFAGCNEGEGASTVVANFASALASDGEKVLLVDANLRSPSLHAVFNVGRENGFTDLLLGKSSFGTATKGTRIPNLSVMTSGTLHPNPTALLESDFLESHLAAMREGVRWVLFDAPPLARFMDAIVLAPRVDGVVMVVEAEKTRWEVAESSRERIVNGNGKVLGAVLNKRRYPVPNWVYKRM